MKTTISATLLLAALALPTLAACGGDQGEESRLASAHPHRGVARSPVSAPRKSPGPRVGSAAGLPRLFPAAVGSVGVGEPVPADLPGQAGATVRIEGHVSPDGVADGDVEVVLDEMRGRLQAPVSAGWPPVLLRQPLHDGWGVVVSQEGGDSDTWTVFTTGDGRLVRAVPDSDVPIGGGFTRDGEHGYLSWLTPDGHLYTRVGLSATDHFRVWSWGVVGATLHATDLGVVCLDLMVQPERYGTC
ncbi:hypothetical protein [Nocardioides sp. LS1]|uniref:hypothetical protein n=1 Tax=Nocardioides sp. LS1 TaxID=1027620 RepID=UPI000F61602E|nr:hypothetical protein [Nocardioides sp. LS1]